MNRKSFLLLVLCLAWVSVLSLAGHLEAVTYTYLDLGALPGATMSRANALNDLGQATGWSNDYAFRWTPGTPPKMENLGNPGLFTEGFGINNAGQVVGYSKLGDYTEHGFFCGSGSMQILDPLLSGKDCRAYGINDAGHIVGYTIFGTIPNDFSRPCWWTADSIVAKELFFPPGYLGGLALAVNRSGQVAGHVWEFTGSEVVTRACRWTIGSDTLQLLGTLGGNSWSTAINNAGQVIGESETGDGRRHVFLWSPGGGMEDLTPNFVGCYAYGINDFGQVTFFGQPESGPSGDYVWSRRTGIQFLNDLVVNLPPGLTINNSKDINNQGEIVALGSNQHACLLTPSEKPLIGAYIPLLLLVE